MLVYAVAACLHCGCLFTLWLPVYTVAACLHCGCLFTLWLPAYTVAVCSVRRAPNAADQWRLFSAYLPIHSIVSSALSN